MNKVSLQLPGIINRCLEHAESIAIISHVNPDGDAVGSSLALYHYLKKAGKDASVIMPNEYPDFLKWLPGSDHVIIFSKNRSTAENIIQKADLIFLLDFNTPDRAGKIACLITESKASKIMIDHHPNPADFSGIIFSDTLSSSTAELIYRFIELTGEQDLISCNSATCLYTGIMADTGSFSYNSSQPETYRVL